MNKNMILAVVLSVVVLYIWGEFFAPKPDPKQNKTAQHQTIDTREKEIEEAKKAEEARKNALVAGLPQKGNLQLTVKNQTAQAKISNDHLMFDMSSAQGRITQAFATDAKYKQKNVDMVAGVSKGNYFPEISSTFASEPDYIIAGSTANSVKFQYEQDGIVETKEVTLRDGYAIDVVKTITNKTDKPIDYIPAVNFSSQHKNEKIFSSYQKVFEIQIMTGESGLHDISDNDKLKEVLDKNKTFKWAGVNYGGFFQFSVINKESKNVNIIGSIDKDSNTTFLSVRYPPIRLEPGQESKNTFFFYLGPKELEKLGMASSDLEVAVSFGWLDFIAKPLLSVLNFFFNFVHNYGVAIILLTVLVKLLLWPLSMASFKSFAKMKKLTPKINALKEKYAKDKETLNKEVMLLYKTEGVNPLGGCLPMLIQMPIYIALYTMLNNAVELYNSPFLPFWLTDLSEQDPIYLLPLVIGVLMFVQQKMTPQQIDNQQAKMMLYIMPPMFTVFLLFLPCGLNIYILANSLLGILQQVYVNKKYA